METINHKCYVSFEVAKLLKKAGFDWEEHYPKNFCYVNDDHELFDKSVLKNYIGDDDVIYLAPTLAVAQRWLREVKHLDIIVNRNFSIYEHQYSWEYEYVIIAADGGVEAVDCYFDVYEEAQEAGIKEALELILEKGE